MVLVSLEFCSGTRSAPCKTHLAHRRVLVNTLLKLLEDGRIDHSLLSLRHGDSCCYWWRAVGVAVRVCLRRMKLTSLANKVHGNGIASHAAHQF